MADRTDKDYAIEHAGYMADAARHLMQCMDHEFDASEALEAAEAADAENAAEKAEDLGSIQQDLVEARSALSNRIYEFEKRRDRALRTPLQHPSYTYPRVLAQALLVDDWLRNGGKVPEAIAREFTRALQEAQASPPGGMEAVGWLYRVFDHGDWTEWRYSGPANPVKEKPGLVEVRQLYAHGVKACGQCGGLGHVVHAVGVKCAACNGSGGVAPTGGLDFAGVPVPRENSWQRPSKEWYAEKIADAQQAEDAAGGVLAAGALGVRGCLTCKHSNTEDPTMSTEHHPCTGCGKDPNFANWEPKCKSFPDPFAPGAAGLEARVAGAVDKLMRCPKGCANFGQCKAAMHGDPGGCAAGVKGLDDAQQ